MRRRLNERIEKEEEEFEMLMNLSLNGRRDYEEREGMDLERRMPSMDYRNELFLSHLHSSILILDEEKLRFEKLEQRRYSHRFLMKRIVGGKGEERGNYH